MHAGHQVVPLLEHPIVAVSAVHTFAHHGCFSHLFELTCKLSVQAARVGAAVISPAQAQQLVHRMRGADETS